MGPNLFIFQFVLPFISYSALAVVSFMGFNKTGQKGFMVLGIAAIGSLLGWLQPLLVFAQDFFHFSMTREGLMQFFPMVLPLISIAASLLYPIGVYLLVQESPANREKTTP